MTKQPVLTDFPHTVFATAKRRLQAAIRKDYERSLRDSISGYSQVFADVLPPEFLSSIDPTLRQRRFGHRPLFWAWLAQILEGNASCAYALSLMQTWAREHDLPVPSSDTSGYCQARQRMDLDFLKAIHERVLYQLDSSIAPKDQWRGLTLKAIDGTSCQLADTPANQEVFPQPKSQKPGCGFPVFGGVGLVNLSHGGIETFVSSPGTTHDAKTAPHLLKTLNAKELLLADRAFCSYEIIATVTHRQRGHCLMRLHQSRHGILNWSQGKRLSKNERLVTWKKGRKPPKSTLTPDEWEALPETLTLRLIKLGYENRAEDRSEIVLVTDLLDPVLYPVDELSDLYHERWKIELTFRDLKTTMKLEKLEVKSPAMAEKTALMMQIAYNLLRLLMQKAAHEANEPIFVLGLSACRDSLIHRQHLFRGMRRRSRKRLKCLKELITDLGSWKLFRRPFRREPRALKKRHKNYQLLNRPRAVFKEIMHREHYRKPA